jgi:hypothetical protein
MIEGELNLWEIAESEVFIWHYGYAVLGAWANLKQSLSKIMQFIVHGTDWIGIYLPSQNGEILGIRCKKHTLMQARKKRVTPQGSYRPLPTK